MTLYDLLYYLIDDGMDVELWNEEDLITDGSAHDLMDYFGDFEVESFYPMTDGRLSVTIDTDGEDVEEILKDMEEE